MSVPMEQVAISLSFGSSRRMSPGHLTALRVFMMTPAPSTLASCSALVAGLVSYRVTLPYELSRSRWGEPFS